MLLLLLFARRELSSIILEAVLVERESGVRGKESENNEVVWLSCRERCMEERRKKKKRCMFENSEDGASFILCKSCRQFGKPLPCLRWIYVNHHLRIRY